MTRRLVVLGTGGVASDRDAMFGLPESGSCVTTTLLPFAASATRVSDMIDLLRSQGYNVDLVDPSAGMEAAALSVRDSLLDLVAEAGDIRSGGSSLRQRLAGPGGSFWWQTLFSEKSTLKTPHFQQLVRLAVIVEQARSCGAETLVLVDSDPLLAEALRQSSALSNVNIIEAVPGRVKRLGDHLKACAVGARDHDKLRRRIHLDVGKQGLSGHPADVLCVTYYPKFESHKAKQGRFVTNYYARLQRMLEEQGKRIAWAGVYVPSQSMSLEEALDAVRGFREQGVDFCFPEHFLEPSDYAACAAGQLRALGMVLRAESALHNLCRRYQPRYGWWPIILDWWHQSFAGYNGLWTRLMRRAFERMAESCPASRLFYTFENQAWERAMLSGVRAARPDMHVVGYQAQTISRLELNFFNRHQELQGEEPLPLPDVVACNGQYIRESLMESGIDGERLPVVEAVNYGHLFEAVRAPWRKKREYITLMGTINADETAGLMALCLKAFSGDDSRLVWFRPHPFCKLDSVCERLGMSTEDIPFTLADGPLSEIFENSAAIIGAGSTVMVEALAYGCRAIACAGGAWFNLSPLFGLESALWASVDSPEALRSHALAALEAVPGCDSLREEAERILHFYFLPDVNPSGPQRLFYTVLES